MGNDSALQLITLAKPDSLLPESAVVQVGKRGEEPAERALVDDLLLLLLRTRG